MNKIIFYNSIFLNVFYMKLCTNTNFNNSRHKFLFIIDVIIVIYDVIVFADVVNLVRDEKGQIVQYLKSLTRI